MDLIDIGIDVATGAIKDLNVSVTVECKHKD